MKYITARRLNLFFTGLKNGAIKTKEESMACTDPKRLVGNGVVKELNNSLNGIEFRIVNGVLQYRYPESGV